MLEGTCYHSSLIQNLRMNISQLSFSSSYATSKSGSLIHCSHWELGITDLIQKNIVSQASLPSTIGCIHHLNHQNFNTKPFLPINEKRANFIFQKTACVLRYQFYTYVISVLTSAWYYPPRTVIYLFSLVSLLSLYQKPKERFTNK